MKGLESLIPKKRNENDDKISPSESVFMIEVEKIHPNPFQPRRNFDEGELKDLAASIQQFGILQPLIVSKVEKDTPGGRDVEYELIAGERRLRAAQIANLPQVPVVVRRPKTPEKLAISVVENIQRQDLNPVEEAQAFERLNKQFGMSMADIAKQLGKSQPVIANAVRMLRLPEDMLTAIEEGRIYRAHSRYLLMLGGQPEGQRKLFQEMLIRNLDRSAIEERVRQMQEEVGERKPRTIVARVDSDLSELAERMKDSIGIHNIKVNRLGRKARIFIEFPTKGQLMEWMKGVLGKE